jgi:hypothetical protein
VRTPDAFAGLEPERYVDWRGNRNDGNGNNGSRADVAQAATMLAGVMRFLLVGEGCRLRTESGAEDEQDQQQPPDRIATT